MKLTSEQKEMVRHLASEHRKTVDFVLAVLCQLQADEVLKTPALDKERLGYEMARLEGARKLSNEFRRLLQPVQAQNKAS